MANESAIRAGQAYVELYADNTKLVQNMKASETHVRAFGSNISAMGSKVANSTRESFSRVGTAVNSLAPAMSSAGKSMQGLSAAAGLLGSAFMGPFAMMTAAVGLAIAKVVSAHSFAEQMGERARAIFERDRQQALDARSQMLTDYYATLDLQKKAAAAANTEAERIGRGERTADDEKRYDALIQRLNEEASERYLQTIQNKYDRERAAARRHYQQMEAEAKRANELRFLRGESPDGASLALIDRARKAALDGIAAREQAEQAAANKQRRQQAGAQREQIQADLDRMAIETDASLTADKKQTALLDLRHKQERAAFFAGPFGAGDEDLLFQRQNLERRQLLMAQAGARSGRQTVAGTFSAAIAGRMGGNADIALTRKAAEKQLKVQQEIRDVLRGQKAWVLK